MLWCVILHLNSLSLLGTSLDLKATFTVSCTHSSGQIIFFLVISLPNCKTKIWQIFFCWIIFSVSSGKELIQGIIHRLLFFSFPLTGLERKEYFTCLLPCRMCNVLQAGLMIQRKMTTFLSFTLPSLFCISLIFNQALSLLLVHLSWSE